MIIPLEFFLAILNVYGMTALGTTFVVLSIVFGVRLLTWVCRAKPTGRSRLQQANGCGSVDEPADHAEQRGPY